MSGTDSSVVYKVPIPPTMSSPELMTQSETAIIQMERISLRYGRGPEILSDIDLTLQPGSFSFLTGASGAGKSSLLKMIYLTLAPTRGLISLFGKTLTDLDTKALQDLKRKIGVVSQDYELIPHLTVFENAALPLRATGRSRSSYDANTKELLDWVGLGQKLDHSPQTLSGGEQQRVAIARAVMTKPDILIADEPTGNVDPDMGKRLLRLFLEMNRMGTTVLIATHDHGLLNQIKADRFHLENGHVSQKAAA